MSNDGNPEILWSVPLCGLRMERDVDLRIKGHLYEIASVNDEVLESRQGFPASERGYRKTPESVVAIAGPDLLDEMAAYIEEYIQDRHERPRIKPFGKRHGAAFLRPAILPTNISTLPKSGGYEQRF